MKELAERWLDYAERDRRTCEQIKEASDLASVAAFHIQQLIEKSLKALLIYSGANPPKIHDLVRLSAECTERFADLPTDECLLGISIDRRHVFYSWNSTTGEGMVIST